MKKQKHLYAIKKFVEASSAKEAIKLDKNTEVHDVWIDTRNIEQAGFDTNK